VEYLHGTQDLRCKLDGTKKLKVEMVDHPDELAETKEALIRVTNEMNKMREEMAEFRKEAGFKSAETCGGFALGFSDKEFLLMNPTKSLQWVSGTLVPRLKIEMDKHNLAMAGLNNIIGRKSAGVWTCAGFNRGGSCHAKWHVHERSCKTKPSVMFKDLRLHCCTLCYDGLGILCEHPLTDCPWIKADTWKKLENGTSVNN